MTWTVTDMGWKRSWNWKLSVTPFGHYDEHRKFHWNGAIQLWLGPFCFTRLHDGR